MVGKSYQVATRRSGGGENAAWRRVAGFICPLILVLAAGYRAGIADMRRERRADRKM